MQTTPQIADTLTPEQTDALQMEGQTCCLIAGPGSGKTHLLTARILRDSKTTRTNQMVIVTFTNAAAKEIRERIQEWGGNPAEFRHIGTLHAWATSCLHRSGDSRTIATERQIADMTKRIVKACGSMARGMSGAEIWRNAVSPPNYGTARTVGLSLRNLMKTNGLTHHDLILADFLALVRDYQADTPQAIYVDEYQDSCPTDQAIYSAFLHRGSSLYLIGDPRQAIYGFRGTSPDHLIHAYDVADQRAQLTLNHRSGAQICKLATAIAKEMQPPGDDCKATFDPTVEPVTTDRDSVSRLEFQSPESEALAIVAWADAGDAATRTMAVLTRYNSAARQIAATLRNHGHLVQCTADTQDQEAGVFARDAIERIQAWGHVPPTAIADPWDWWRATMIHLGIPMALQDQLLPRLIAVATLHDLVSLQDPSEPIDRRRITVATIHGAKGLEWDSVWIAGADEKAIPDTPEAGRLAFVAATRARRQLTISIATGRTEPESGKRLTNLAATRWFRYM